MVSLSEVLFNMEYWIATVDLSIHGCLSMMLHDALFLVFELSLGKLDLDRINDMTTNV